MGAEIRLHPPGPASPSALTQQHPLCRTLRAYVFVQENRRSVLIKISRARCHEARRRQQSCSGPPQPPSCGASRLHVLRFTCNRRTGYCVTQTNYLPTYDALSISFYASGSLFVRVSPKTRCWWRARRAQGWEPSMEPPSSGLSRWRHGHPQRLQLP